MTNYARKPNYVFQNQIFSNVTTDFKKISKNNDELGCNTPGSQPIGPVDNETKS